MAWDNILDQSQPVSLLRRSVASGRVAHAYLFHGPDGVGKRAVAIELARMLQCRSTTGDACHACSSCKRVRALQHPDVHVLFPQPRDVAIEETRERLATLAKDPYATIDFSDRKGAKGKPVSNKQAFYPMSRIADDLHRLLAFRPNEGPYQVVVVTQADAMKEPAANAFLKLLEEPGDETVLILTTSRTDLLLPTILSRCQRVRFGMLPESVIAQALRQRQGTEPEAAQLYARMAAGSYSAAQQLASNESLLDVRQSALEFLRHAFTSRQPDQLSLIEDLMAKGRDHVKVVLDYILVWIRDLVLWCELEDDAHITNIDKEDIVAKFSGNLDQADLDGLAGLVDEGREFVGREINLRILLIALIQAIGRAMRDGNAGRLYVPLA